ncbi:MAG TPA: hypothetical protein VEL28_17910 [Candidatus Binatia bacterium]|nr:hypothetical protein [Candidatus Binatia bacterium]
MPSWSEIAAFALMGAGALLIVRNVRSWRKAAATLHDPERALWLARGFRVGIVGLCAVAAGAGWYWQVYWLIGLAVIIAGEELLETTVLVMALRDGQRQRGAETAEPPLSQEPPQR